MSIQFCEHQVSQGQDGTRVGHILYACSKKSDGKTQICRCQYNSRNLHYGKVNGNGKKGIYVSLRPKINPCEHFEPHGDERGLAEIAKRNK
jgi:hypothetical protein